MRDFFSIYPVLGIQQYTRVVRVCMGTVYDLIIVSVLTPFLVFIFSSRTFNISVRIVPARVYFLPTRTGQLNIIYNIILNTKRFHTFKFFFLRQPTLTSQTDCHGRAHTCRCIIIINTVYADLFTLFFFLNFSSTRYI